MPEGKQNRAPGRLYYGWVIVAVSFAALVVAFGIRLSFSVFFVALIDDFGWARAGTSMIFSAGMVTFALTSTISGAALDRFGARRTFGFGTLVLALGMFLSARVSSFWQLVIAYGVVAGLGITILGLGLQAALISNWFRRRRGTAIGIAFAGTGVGSLLMTPAVEWMIRRMDWRSAYTGLGWLALAGLPFVAGLLRSRPEQVGQVVDGRDPGKNAENEAEGQLADGGWTFRRAVRMPAFWLVMLAAAGAIGPVRMLTVHQLAIITDTGISRAVAAGFAGSAGMVTALVFIFTGVLSDRIGRRLTYLLGSAALAGAFIVLAGLSGPSQAGWLYVYVLLAGLGEGTRSSLVTSVAADLFPGRAIGAINGTAGAMFAVGAAVLPWLAGFIFDLKGDYSLAFWIAGGFVLVSTAALWFAPVIHAGRGGPAAAP